jgi:hypothetical protein
VGRYSIAYAVEELGRPGKHQADLVLRVFDAAGDPLGATDSRCQAPAALVPVPPPASKIAVDRRPEVLFGARPTRCG